MVTTRRTAARQAPATARRNPRRRLSIDRVILLRAALAVVVVLFLYTILRMSMIAFGGSAGHNARRIDQAVDSRSDRAPSRALGADETSARRPSR